jgi:hypothetical protein
VDTLDVLKRIGATLFPIPDFFALVEGRQDLYGWFWIATTLIFAVAAAGSFASFLTYALNDQLEKWKYDFAKLGFGALTVSVYVTVCPALAFVSMRLWLELRPSLIDHFCLYGYSLFPYIPAAVVMIIPVEWVRWLIMVLACTLVCVFLARNYLPHIRPKPAEGGVVLFVLLLFNVLFALILQLYFFEYAVEARPDNGSDSPSPMFSPSLSVTPSTSVTPSNSIQILESIAPSPIPSSVPSSSPEAESVSMAASPIPISDSPSLIPSISWSSSPTPTPTLSLEAQPTE